MSGLLILPWRTLRSCPDIRNRSIAPDRRAERQARRFASFGRSDGMPSTVIRRFTYAESQRELTIEFVSGRRYVYSQVPPEQSEAMRSAFSKGSYFNRYIRDCYPCRELV